MASDVDGRHDARMREIEREHAARMAKLKADADDRIDFHRRHRRELLTEYKRSGELLREETMEKRRQADRAELTQRREYREFIRALNGKLTELDVQQQLDEEEERNADPRDPRVVKLRQWLEWVEAENGIDARECAAAELRNGAAVRDARYTLVPAVKSLITATIRAHEDGHLLHDDLPHERIAKQDFTGKISPQAEIASWRWVLDNTPVWTEKQRAFMARALDSYRSYATPEEQTEMDRLCGSLSYRSVLLRIARG